MAKTEDLKRSAKLKRALKKQGRTTTWLAEACGYSRSYVSNVVNGHMPMTDEFQQRAAKALDEASHVPIAYRGRVIQVPENIYRRQGSLPLIVVESVYEEAWKRAWLQENAQTTLAAAADRAWQVAQASAA